MEAFSAGSKRCLDGNGVDLEQGKEDDNDLADVKRRGEVGWAQHEQEQVVELRQPQRQRGVVGE